MMKCAMSFFILLFSQGALAIAGPGSLFTYEGVLTDASNTPITTAQSVKFQIIYSSSCVVYEETQSVTPGSMGEFSVMVGAGSRTDATGNTLDRIFASSGSVNCNGAAATTVTSFATRSLRIEVNSVVLSPDVTIGNIPFAINAQRLADKAATDFVQTSTVITQTRMNDIANLFSIAPSDGQLMIGSGGVYQPGFITAGTGIGITNSPGGITISATSSGSGTVTSIAATPPLIVTGPTPSPTIGISQATGSTNGYLNSTDWNKFNDKLAASLADGKIWIGNTAGVPSPLAISGDATLNNAGVLTLKNVGTAGTYTKVVTDAQGRVTGSASLVATDIPNLPWSQITTTPTTLSGYGITDALVKNLGNTPGIQSGSDTAKPTAGTSGRVYIATDTQKIYQDNGTIWVLLSSGTGGGTVANVSSANSDIGVASGATNPVLTLNSGTGANQIPKLDASGKLATSILPSSTMTTSSAFAGDVSGTSAAMSVDKLKGVIISGTAPSTAGQVLRYSGSAWGPNFISMADLRSTITGASALTSCASNKTLTWSAATDNLACSDISLPAGQVTGTLPVANGGTGSGTTSQGFVFAGPSSGGSGAPSFRAIASTDLPSGTLSGSGTVGSVPYYNTATTLANSGLFYDGANVGIGTSTPTNLLSINGTATIPLSVTSSSNTYTAINLTNNNSTPVVYSLRAYASSAPEAGALAIYKAGTANIFINSSGNMGIGTTTPAEKLDVGGGNVKMGYERLNTVCNSATSCTATCTAGKNVIGGGCFMASGTNKVVAGYPDTDTTWKCIGGATDNITAYAICANMR